MKRQAFTLIELLVVIIILGVLATLAAPRITAQVQTARATEAMQFFGVFRRFSSDCLGMSNGKVASCVKASQIGVEIPTKTAFTYQSMFKLPPKTVVKGVAQQPLKGATVTFRAKREDPPGTFVAAICMQMTLDAKANVDKVEFSSYPTENPFSVVVARTGAENPDILCDEDFPEMK